MEKPHSNNYLHLEAIQFTKLARDSWAQDTFTVTK